MKLHYGDLTDSTCLVKIINEVKPTEIYNLGAQSHVKVSLLWGGAVGLFVFRVVPAAYGGSQARGQISAAAAGLHHRHSHAGSEPRLSPARQLMAMPDP